MLERACYPWNVRIDNDYESNPPSLKKWLQWAAWSAGYFLKMNENIIRMSRHWSKTTIDYRPIEIRLDIEK